MYLPETRRRNAGAFVRSSIGARAARRNTRSERPVDGSPAHAPYRALCLPTNCGSPASEGTVAGVLAFRLAHEDPTVELVQTELARILDKPTHSFDVVLSANSTS